MAGSIHRSYTGNTILPHSKDSSDAFVIGDVYTPAPSAAAQEWEINLAGRPYLQHIKGLSLAWPDLRYLADWMEVTTAPIKWGDIKHFETTIRAERASRTKVAVIDFLQDEISVKIIEDAVSLATCIQHDQAPEGAHRLFVVEDLSRDVIEILGDGLDIDPFFFREHISDYLWYNTRDPWVELPVLRVVTRDRTFFRMRYFRARYFASEESLERARQEAAMFNVLRRIDHDKNYNAMLDNPGSCVGLMRSKASFWTRPTKSDSTGKIGVLLIDPSITEGFPLWNGYRNFNNPPSLKSKHSVENPPRNSSLFDDLLFWTRHMTNNDVLSISQNPTIMALPMAQIICAEWLTISQYITTRLSQIEWELEEPKFRKHPKGIDFSFTKLQSWRRTIPLYKNMCVGGKSNFFCNISLAHDDYASDLHKDYEAVQAVLEQLERRIERIAAIATAIISIEESRRGIDENRSLGRLTYLVVIFAPLSFVSSIFSMNSDLKSLKLTFWVYFCVSFPFSLAVFIIVGFVNFQQWYHKAIDRNRAKN